MEWNNSGIGPAIQRAKSLKALFVVVIHGDEDDDNSKHFLNLMNDPSVTALLSEDTCVALKLKHESEGCKQFNALYPVILVPSIYFIDSSSGVDVEVTGGLQITKDRLLESIKKALSVAKINPPEPTVNSDDVLSPRGVRVEQAREVLRQTWNSSNEENSEVTKSNSDSNGDQKQSTASNQEVPSSLSLEERVARAKQLLAARKEQEDQELENKSKNTEMERRQLGKQMQDTKRTQEDNEAIKAAEERRKDREETKLARERVKAQIEQDRLEKQAKFDIQKQHELEEKRQREKSALEEQSAQAEQLAAARSTLARVQFRLPEGGTRTNAFSADAPLSDIYKYVTEEMSDSVAFRSGFSLLTTFPRSLLDEKPMDMHLRELGLAPSGTVLVLPKSGSLVKSGGMGGGIMDLFWLLLTPLTVLWGIMTSFVTPTTTTGPSTTPRAEGAEGRQFRNQRNTKTNNTSVRSDGNIARLRNLSDDDDDENNTWNGNSTQQQ